MVSTVQISELLLRWEDLRARGQSTTAEELCRDCPELVDEVRRQIQALEAMYRVPNEIATLTDPPRGGPDPKAAQAEPAHLAGYEILGELGHGGMGVVYRARQVALKRVVALKMILAGAWSGPRELARFRAEAATAARLQHPNIVSIYEVGEQGGRPYCAMELVDGG